MSFTGTIHKQNCQYCCVGIIIPVIKMGYLVGLHLAEFPQTARPGNRIRLGTTTVFRCVLFSFVHSEPYLFSPAVLLFVAVPSPFRSTGHSRNPLTLGHEKRSGDKGQEKFKIFTKLLFNYCFKSVNILLEYTDSGYQNEVSYVGSNVMNVRESFFLDSVTFLSKIHYRSLNDRKKSSFGGL